VDLQIWQPTPTPIMAHAPPMSQPGFFVIFLKADAQEMRRSTPNSR
jgi:hypothetical protein